MMVLNLKMPRTAKKIINADELKRLAALGLSRREIAKRMKRPYAQFWHAVNNSMSLSEAYTLGVQMFIENKLTEE